MNAMDIMIATVCCIVFMVIVRLILDVDGKDKTIKRSDMKPLTKEAQQAKESCKNMGIKDGYQNCWVVNFQTHPTEIESRSTCSSVVLATGYGIKRYDPRTDTHHFEADEDATGRPIPYNSYWEALSQLGIRF